MSFFGQEFFNLPGGDFQDFLNTDTAGNGSIYRDETYGYIITSADADGAIIFSDALTVTEFIQTQFTCTIKYQITNLPDGDRSYPLNIMYKATAPEIGSTGTPMAYMRVDRSGATYYERWYYYDTTATLKIYDNATSGWTADTTDYVRNTLALDTEYTITITWHPESRTFTFTNGTTTKETGITRIPTTEDVYWWLGDNETAAYYASLKIVQISAYKSGGLVQDLTSRNAILTDGFVNGYFDGGDILISNAILTDGLDGFYFQNEIRDYDWTLDGINVQNRIGVLADQITMPDCQVLIDGGDASGHCGGFTITGEEGGSSNNLEMTLYGMEYLSLYKSDGTEYDSPRVSVYIDGVIEGTFFIETIEKVYTARGVGMRISGPSKTAILDRPYSKTITKVWDETTTRHAIITEVIASLVNASIQISDATVMANLYAAKKLTPLQIIADVIEATGGEMVTDSDDNLIVYRKPFSDEGVVPVLPVGSNRVSSLTESPKLRTGENSVAVSSVDKGYNSTKWADVVLSADKLEVSSNGSDFITLTADVVDELGQSPDVELYEDEECTPSQPHKISVSHYIPKSASETPFSGNGGEVIGIWEDEAHTTLVAGPYKWEGTEIETVGAMSNNTPYYITYRGAELVSWVIDGDGTLVDSEPDAADPDKTIFWEDAIRDGKVIRKLVPTTGAAGTIEIYAVYDGQESNHLFISVDDPRIGRVVLTADPTTIGRGFKTSVLRAEVTGPTGAPVASGIDVEFQIYEGEGTIGTATAVTGTETEVEEQWYVAAKDTVVVPENALSVQAVYYLYNGKPTTFNYASGATLVGNSLHLATPLPEAPCWVRLEFTSGGIALSNYVSPAAAYGSVKQMVGLVAYCGGKPGYAEITLGGTKDGGATVSKLTVPWHYGKFEGVFLGDPNHMVGTQEKILHAMAEAVEVELLDVINCTLSTTPVGNAVVVTCTVYADYTENGENTFRNDGMIEGSRQVIDGDTEKPVSNVDVTIDWIGAVQEVTKTDVNGWFGFNNGVPGTSPITFEKEEAGYEEDQQTIDLPADGVPGTSEANLEFEQVAYLGRYRWRYRK